jgi:hypothetical protein
MIRSFLYKLGISFSDIQILYTEYPITDAITKLIIADTIYSASNSETIEGSASKKLFVSNKYCPKVIKAHITKITATPM